MLLELEESFPNISLYSDKYKSKLYLTDGVKGLKFFITRLNNDSVQFNIVDEGQPLIDLIKLAFIVEEICYDNDDILILGEPIEVIDYENLGDIVEEFDDHS